MSALATDISGVIANLKAAESSLTTQVNNLTTQVTGLPYNTYYFSFNATPQTLVGPGIFPNVNVGTASVVSNISSALGANVIFTMPVGIYYVQLVCTVDSSGGTVGFGTTSATTPSIISVAQPGSSTISQSCLVNNTSPLTAYSVTVPAAQTVTINYVSLCMFRIA